MSSDSSQITGRRRKRKNGDKNEKEMIQVDNPSKVGSKVLRKSSLREDYFWSNGTSACQMESCTSEFVNHGLLLWNQTRQQWCGNKTPNKCPSVRTPKILDTETLLGTNELFPQPIPLPEMVDFLVKVWEEELYD